jgi:hypothetical protein
VLAENKNWVIGGGEPPFTDLLKLLSRLFHQSHKVFKGLWQYSSLIARIACKAILPGGCSFGAWGASKIAAI